MKKGVIGFMATLMFLGGIATLTAAAQGIQFESESSHIEIEPLCQVIGHTGWAQSNWWITGFGPGSDSPTAPLNTIMGGTLHGVRFEVIGGVLNNRVRLRVMTHFGTVHGITWTAATNVGCR